MYQLPIAHKNCATCRWWSGRRKLIFVGANPQLISVEPISDLPRICFHCIKWEKL